MLSLLRLLGLHHSACISSWLVARLVFDVIDEAITSTCNHFVSEAALVLKDIITPFALAAHSEGLSFRGGQCE